MGAFQALMPLYQGPSTVRLALGLGAAVTTAVAAEDAVVEPAESLAVTETRIVDPTSNDARRYVVPLAPAIDEQEPPPESQRCH
jgi:hypothetical protein